MSDNENHTDVPTTVSTDNLVDNELLPEKNLSEPTQQNDSTKVLFMEKVDELNERSKGMEGGFNGSEPKYDCKDKFTEIELKDNSNSEFIDMFKVGEYKNEPTEPEDTPRANVNKLITIEPTLFLTMFGLALQMITTSTLTIDKVCHVTLNYSDEICNNYSSYPEESKKIDTYSADLGMYNKLISTIPAVLYAFFLGSWSDKHGRKFPIIFPLFGYICSTICIIILAYYSETPPEYLMINSAFVGLTGGTVSTILGCFSYITDITTQAQRTKRIALADLALFIALPFGMVLSSSMFNKWSYIPIYAISLVTFCLSFIYSLFFVPETIQAVNDNSRKCNLLRDMFDLHNVIENLKVCTAQRKGNDRIYINFMLFSMFILLFPLVGESGVMLLFVRTVFGWDQTTLGYYTAYSIVITAIGTAVIFRFLLTKYKVPDLVLGIIGLSGIFLKGILTAISSAGWMLYMAATVSFFQFIGMPTIRSFVSKLVNKEEIGKLYAVISSCDALSPLVSSIAYTQLYIATRDTYPGAIFLFSSGLVAMPLAIFAWILFNTRKLNKYKRFEEEGRIST